MPVAGSDITSIRRIWMHLSSARFEPLPKDRSNSPCAVLSGDVSNPRISALLQNRGKTDTFMPFSTIFRLVSYVSSLPTARMAHCISIDHQPHTRRKFATRPNRSGALKTKVRERQQSRKSSTERPNECALKAQTPSRISFSGRLQGLQGHFQNQSRMHSRRQTVFQGLRPSCD